MCWISAGATQKVTDKDFYVYKIGQVLKNGTFVSHYKYFKYVPKTRNKTIPLIVQVPCRSVHIIQKGYHSYKWIAFDDAYPRERCLCLGNYDPALKENLSLYKHCCIATFVVPRGAKYYENEYGCIVSSEIIYTGKYIKL